jgi:hypothetical protein
MFGWQLKLGIAAAVALAFGALLWHDKHQTNRANRLATEKNQLLADYNALREAQERERELAKAATDDYEERLAALEVARSDIPVRSVRLCRSPTGWVPAPSHASLGTPAGVTGEQPAEAGRDIEVSRDIGPELYALADQADERAAQCNALISWARSR